MKIAKRSVSIVEARAHLSGLVRDAEEGTPVEITRFGRPVAVLVSATKYQEMARGRPSFGSALDQFLEDLDMTRIGIGGGEFEGLRDPGAGRMPPW